MPVHDIPANVPANVSVNVPPNELTNIPLDAPARGQMDGCSSPQLHCGMHRWSGFVMDDSQPQMDTYDTPQLDPVDEDLGDDDDSDDEEKALGRLSEVNRRLIKTELLAVQKRAKEVAAQTGLSTSQVFNHWTSASRRKHTKLNTWNLYSKYFKANQEKEIARLRTPIPDDVPEVNVRQQCYKAFLADVEPKAMEILKKFHMARALTAGSKGQSYGERKAEFRKLTTKLTDLMDTYEAMYGFSGVFAIAGSVPNSDSGLGEMHETQNAKKFFEVRCRAKHDIVMTHLKAHIYDLNSRNLVAMTFDEPLVAALAQRAVVAAKATIDGVANDPSHLSQKAAQSSSAVNEPESEPEPEPLVCTLGSDDEPEEPRKLGALIANHLITQLNSLKIPDVPSWKNFPWKKFGQQCCKHKIIAHNWPDGVQFPPVVAYRRGKGSKKVREEDDADDEEDEEDEEERKVMKSIQHIPYDQLHLLYCAIRDEKYPLHFKLYKDGKSADLQKGLDPILWGVPPPYNSKHTHGRRLFADGRSDRNGLARRRPRQHCDSPAHATSNSNEKKEPSRNAGPSKVASDSDSSFLGDSDAAPSRAIPVSIQDAPIKRKPAATHSEPLYIASGSDDASSHSHSELKQKHRKKTKVEPTARSNKVASKSLEAISAKRKRGASDARVPTPLTSKNKGKSREAGDDMGPGNSVNGDRKRVRFDNEDIPLYGHMDDGTNVDHNVHLNVPSNVHLNVRSNVPSNVPSNVHPNVRSNVPGNVSSNVPGNISPNVPGNVPSNISPNVHLNVGSNIPSNVPGNVPSNVALNVHPNLRSNGGQGASMNVDSLPSTSASQQSLWNLPWSVQTDRRLDARKDELMGVGDSNRVWSDSGPSNFSQGATSSGGGGGSTTFVGQGGVGGQGSSAGHNWLNNSYFNPADIRLRDVNSSIDQGAPIIHDDPLQYTYLQHGNGTTGNAQQGANNHSYPSFTDS